MTAFRIDDPVPEIDQVGAIREGCDQPTRGEIRCCNRAFGKRHAASGGSRLDHEDRLVETWAA